MLKPEKPSRDEALSPSGMLLSAQMRRFETVTVNEHLWLFAKRIEAYGLRPWGRTGKHYFDGAVDLMVQDGAYESLEYCWSCSKVFQIMDVHAHANTFLTALHINGGIDIPEEGYQCETCLTYPPNP